jgi:hypothetical protein
MVFMDNTTNKFLAWKILGWNLRGTNAESKQLALREKMIESGCVVACVQETKKESFDSKFIKKIRPTDFDNFVGASGGILVVWKSAMFEGRLIQSRKFGVIIEFTSRHTAQKWTLVCVYGPCAREVKDQFVQWLYDLNIPNDEL